MSGYHWRTEEIEQLIDLSTRYPAYRLRHVYRSWAARNGYPVRTDIAIARKLRGLGRRARPVDDNWNCKTLADLLGFQHARVWNWFRLYPGWLPRQKGRGIETVVISRKSLQQFAKEHPHLFRGASIEGLQIALGKRLAEEVRQSNPEWCLHRPVFCVETWQVFPSARDAAESICPWHPKLRSVARAIRRCCNGGQSTTLGYHWRFADEQEAVA